MRPKLGWEKSVLDYIIEHVDPSAVSGKDIRLANVDSRLFDAAPDTHSLIAQDLRELYDLLSKLAQDDNRLTAGDSLVKRWVLKWDIYSPKLKRFIEVDGSTHFSRIRLTRLLANQSASWKPEYTPYF